MLGAVEGDGGGGDPGASERASASKRVEERRSERAAPLLKA
jgi:hypothetical protein